MNASRHHLAEVIGKRSLRTTNTKTLARELAAYLLETNQTNSLESLMRDVMAYRAEHGVVEATAVSAHSLTADVKRQVRHILKDQYPDLKTTMIDEKLDPSVIGGIRVEMPGEQLDATVEAKLNTFKRLMAQRD